MEATALKHQLTAQDILVLCELLKVQAEIVSSQAIIEEYDNPTSRVLPIPDHQYHRHKAIQKAAKDKLQRKLDALTSAQTHIAVAFSETAPLVKPED